MSYTSNIQQQELPITFSQWEHIFPVTMRKKYSLSYCLLSDEYNDHITLNLRQSSVAYNSIKETMITINFVTKNRIGMQERHYEIYLIFRVYGYLSFSILI